MREDYLAERNSIIDETAGSMSEAEAAVFKATEKGQSKYC
jgi:hypothetical protein